MVAAMDRAIATLARERPHDLARALDTGVLLANVRGAFALVRDDADSSWTRIGVDLALAERGLSHLPDVPLLLNDIATIRRALDLAETTLRFLEGEAT